MINLLSWMAFGAVIGFWRAWSKLGGATAHAQAIIDATPELNRKDRARAERYNTGLRVGAGLIYASIGAVAGAVIWGIASLALFGLDQISN